VFLLICLYGILSYFNYDLGLRSPPGPATQGARVRSPDFNKKTISQSSGNTGLTNAFTLATSTKEIATLRLVKLNLLFTNKNPQEINQAFQGLNAGGFPGLRVAIPFGAGNPGCKGSHPRPQGEPASPARRGLQPWTACDFLPEPQKDTSGGMPSANRLAGHRNVILSISMENACKCPSCQPQ
jgi:hypothetical protein